MNLKNILYALTCLSFTVIIGGAVYEHLAVVPQWSAAPPASLSMFQGPYGLAAGEFWERIHPLTFLLFIATLALHWKTERKRNILLSFIGYVVVMITTALYFVPELMTITGTPFSEVVDSSLTARASTWEFLSLLRLAFIIGLAIMLFLGLTKSEIKRSSQAISEQGVLTPQ